MDKIDQNLLIELDKNPKISMSKLAKRLRVSQQVADYRFKRLIFNKQISKLGAIINLKSLKLEHYRIFFTFNSTKGYSENGIFSYLKSKKEVYWSARTGGKYDLLVVLFVLDFEAFDSFIEDFNKSFPGLVKDYKACYVLEHYFYRHKYLSKDYSSIRYGCKEGIVEIDDLDRHILNKIKDDCRISSLELAKGMAVTYKTVLNRIKSLENKKAILGYRLFIKSEEVKPFIILFSFKDYTKEGERNLLSYLAGSPAITQVLRQFGIWNLFVHVRVKDNLELQNLVIDLRNRFHIIDDYEIIPIFQDISINLFPA